MRSRAVPSLIAVPAIALACWGVIAHQGEPDLPGWTEQDAFTHWGRAAFGLIATLFALATLAALLQVVLFWVRPRRGRGEARWGLDEADRHRVRTAGMLATWWGMAAIVQTPFAGAASSGVPVAYALGDPASFLTGTQTAPTWLFTGIGAALLGGALFLATTWPAAIIGSVVAVGLWLPSVVTAQVSVGRDHDWATDLAILHTLALAVWLATLIAGGARRPVTVANRRRVWHVSLWAGAIALVTRVFVYVFELAGTGPLASVYGVGGFALLVVLAALLVSSLVPALGRTPLPALLIGGIVGLQIALISLIPPRFRVPQTDQENYLGYLLPDPPRWPEFLLPGRPNVLLLIIALAAIAIYVAGVVALVRRGDKWPVGRLIGWVFGWIVVVFLATSQVWQYGSALFSFHMAVHMGLNVIAPVLLVLGGPFTLALRVLKPGHPGGPATVRDAIDAVMSWSVLKYLAHPLVVWVLFVGSFYLVYFTPIFEVGMRFHWAHQLMTLHFLITGYWFYAVVIGVDQPPRSLPHVARLGYLFAAMPFHAFYAVIVMGGSFIIGEEFFKSLHLSWNPNLAHEQNLGGQVAWALGEIPLLIAVIILVAQWFRSDERESKRKDRAMDAGQDDSYERYQKMLAELAESDQRADR